MSDMDNNPTEESTPDPMGMPFAPDAFDIPDAAGMPSAIEVSAPEVSAPEVSTPDAFDVPDLNATTVLPTSEPVGESIPQPAPLPTWAPPPAPQYAAPAR